MSAFLPPSITFALALPVIFIAPFAAEPSTDTIASAAVYVPLNALYNVVPLLALIRFLSKVYAFSSIVIAVSLVSGVSLFANVSVCLLIVKISLPSLKVALVISLTSLIEIVSSFGVKSVITSLPAL